MANALATLSSMLQANQGKEMTIHREFIPQGQRRMTRTENDKRTLRRLAAGFFLSGAILYKRSANLALLCYVDDQEAQ
ncbi:hypothetical protein CR513_39006, partial [Mucuna pruriens]